MSALCELENTFGTEPCRVSRGQPFLPALRSPTFLAPILMSGREIESFKTATEHAIA
jgi:hypothetical protein